jgi:hypothetical protein
MNTQVCLAVDFEFPEGFAIDGTDIQRLGVDVLVDPEAVRQAQQGESLGVLVAFLPSSKTLAYSMAADRVVVTLPGGRRLVIKDRRAGTPYFEEKP